MRSPLSLRNVEDLLHERGIDICHETVRFWWHRFEPIFAAEIRKRRVEGMHSGCWRRHLRLIFSEKAKSIEPIPYGDAPSGAMQRPRYTTYAKLTSAKKLVDLI